MKAVYVSKNCMSGAVGRSWEFKRLMFIMTAQIKPLVPLSSSRVPSLILTLGSQFHLGFSLGSHTFSSFQKHTGRCIVFVKLALGVNACVKVCMHCALGWTGISSRLCSCLMLSVPGTGFEFTSTLNRLKPPVNRIM